MNISSFLSLKEIPCCLTMNIDICFLKDVINHYKDCCDIQSNFDIVYMDNENFDANSLLSLCNQTSFFSSGKLFVVRDILTTNKTIQTKLLQIAELASKPNHIIFVDTKQNKSFDFLKLETVASAMTKFENKRYLEQLFKQKGYTISLQALEKFTEYTFQNLSLQQVEFDKLLMFKLETKNINESDIDTIVLDSSELVVFNIIDSLCVKDIEKTLKIIQKMTTSQGDLNKIFAMLATTFKRMFFVSISRQTDTELSKSLNVKEFAIKKLKQQAKMFSPVKLKNIFEKFVELEFAFKSGKMALENCLHFICYFIVK